MDRSENNKDAKLFLRVDSSPDLEFDPSSKSGIKIESLDDDDELTPSGTGGGDVKKTASKSGNTTPAPGDHYLTDTAPIPGNCCGFTSLGCTKFWAILNSIQLVPTWILVFAIDLGTLMDHEVHKEDKTYTMVKCLLMGSPGARGIRKAIQSICLLTYSIASILFLLANFPATLILPHQRIFTILYIWSMPVLLAVFVLPLLFMMPIMECWDEISLLAWTWVLAQLIGFVVYLYFCFRVASIFRNYVRETLGLTSTDNTPRGSRKLRVGSFAKIGASLNCAHKKQDQGSAPTTTPPTPNPSSVDVLEEPKESVHK